MLIVLIIVLKAGKQAGSNEPGSFTEKPTRKSSRKSQALRIVNAPAGGLRLEIEYTDQKGERTKRIVRILRVDSTRVKNPKMLTWCELRQEERSFFINKVSHAVDVSTGEVIDDLRNYLRRAKAS